MAEVKSKNKKLYCKKCNEQTKHKHTTYLASLIDEIKPLELPEFEPLPDIIFEPLPDFDVDLPEIELPGEDLWKCAECGETTQVEDKEEEPSTPNS